MIESSNSASWESIILQIEKTSKECNRISQLLSVRASDIKYKRKVFRGINLVVGALAFVFGIIIPHLVSPSFVKLVTAAAAVALFADGLWPMLFEGDPPETYQIYSFYIGLYAEKLEQAMLEDMPDVSRRAKILVLLDLANHNIRTVKTNWIFTI